MQFEYIIIIVILILLCMYIHRREQYCCQHCDDNLRGLMID